MPELAEVWSWVGGALFPPFSSFSARYLEEPFKPKQQLMSWPGFNPFKGFPWLLESSSHSLEGPAGAVPRDRFSPTS